MFDFDKGIKINGSSIWLDARRVVDYCCVTHGHLDHARKHRLVIATEKTIRIISRRLGSIRSIALSYSEPYEFDGCKITLFPAGHILGSAQILIEKDGRRLLYSGDFNTEKSATAESIIIPESDILIMESTFGKPRYRFPARKSVESQLINFVDSAISQKNVPVVIAYTLGKSQEAMKILGDAGFSMSVHGSIARLARIYEEYGIDLGDWQKYKKEEITGKVLIIPTSAAHTKFIKRLPRKRMVFLSGWAVNPSTKFRNGVDEALPLSDHADFEGLIEYARKVKATKIYTTHGFAEFPVYLRQLGMDAEPLQKRRQLELF